MSSFVGKVALIIEDDRVSIRVLQQLLEQLSIEVVVIDNSYKVFESLEYIGLPDVIFLDLEMPQNSGYKVLQYLHQSADLSNVPIVAYTTHTSHLNEAKKAGFHSFLGKPLDKDLFPNQLERILKGVPVWETS
jgi:CheY-like chemotaxis protein